MVGFDMRRILLGSISIGIAIIIIAILIYRSNLSSKPTKAEFSPVIDVALDTSISTVDEKSTSTQFFVTANAGYLYKSTQVEEGAVTEFLAKDPEVIDSNVQGASTLSTSKIKKKLFPPSISKSLSLLRKSTDPDGTKHLYFTQKINNVPVFGSVLSVHIRNKSEIYAVVGSLVDVIAASESTIPVAEAEEKALEAAASEFTQRPLLHVVLSRQSIFNSGLIESADNATNQKVQEIIVTDNQEFPAYGKRFMVSLQNGEVLYQEPIMHTALNRVVYDCDGNLTNCPAVRVEGSPVSNRRDPDLMYTQLGDVYNYFKNTFQRDSYNNAGAQIKAFVNVVDPNVGCPNAAWIGAPYSEFLICPNMVANDIIAHEFTHAVTEYTARLITTKQSGALNEAVSDIFSFGLDNDWTMAEDAATGIIRNAADPTQDPARSGGPHPDRLFSPYYSCRNTDSGGIHANMTVLTKAFYLMSEGGIFNGCSITGMGKNTAHKIWYRALTTYLTTTANFNYAYLSVFQACIDLYGETSATCQQTKGAFQATEVDQQPSGTQDGALCLNVASRTPQCVGSNTPTVTTILTPTPTQTQVLTPTPTSGTCPLKPKGDSDCNGVIDLIDFEMWRKEAKREVSTQISDYNNDGVVDIVDFEVWRKGRFGQ